MTTIFSVRMNKELLTAFKQSKRKGETTSSLVARLIYDFIFAYKVVKQNKSKLARLVFTTLEYRDSRIKDKSLNMSTSVELYNELLVVCSEINVDKAELIRCLIQKHLEDANK